MHPDDAPGGADDEDGLGDGDDITRMNKMPKVTGSTVMFYNAGRGDVEHETLLLKANESELHVSVSHARPFVPVGRLDDSATSAVAGHEDVEERKGGEQLGRVESNEGERDADCNESAGSFTRFEQVEQAILREEGRGDVEHETLLLKANESELHVSVSHARPFVPVGRLDDSATSAVAGHEDVEERKGGEQLGRVESNEGERDADCNESAGSFTRFEQVEQAILREEEARIASRLNDLDISPAEEELMFFTTIQLEEGAFDEEQEGQLAHVRARATACDLRFTLASLRGVAVSDVKPLLLAAGRAIDVDGAGRRLGDLAQQFTAYPNMAAAIAGAGEMAKSRLISDFLMREEQRALLFWCFVFSLNRSRSNLWSA